MTRSSIDTEVPTVSSDLWSTITPFTRLKVELSPSHEGVLPLVRYVRLIGGTGDSRFDSFAWHVDVRGGAAIELATALLAAALEIDPNYWEPRVSDGGDF